MSLGVLLVLGGALIASLLLNVFFIWYFRNLVSRLRFISENLGVLVEETISFRDHLESVHELEMFYGDETLHSILVHAKGITEFLSEFEDIYELSDDLPNEREEEWESANDSEEGNGTASATEKEKEKKTNKKTVFYSGT